MVKWEIYSRDSSAISPKPIQNSFKKSFVDGAKYNA